MTTTSVPTSGCARRRAKAVVRREHVTELTHRREDAEFYAHGAIPASSTAVALCSCGARAFTRDESGDLGDFEDAHAYCNDEVDE